MFEGLDTFEYILWLCAIAGSVFFGLKMFLSIVSGMDMDMEGDLSAGHIAHDGFGDSDASFQVLSLTSLSAAITMFGWVGLAAYNEFQLGAFVSLVVAVIGAGLTMMFVAWLLSLAPKMTSAGSNFSVDQAIGCSGTVYQEIPAGGTGRVQISVNGATQEIDAEAYDDRDLKSHKNIVVTEVINSTTVRVIEVK